MAMEANKEQSDRCVEIGLKYLREGNRDQAIKFFQKAQKMHPSQRVTSKSGFYFDLLTDGEKFAWWRDVDFCTSPFLDLIEKAQNIPTNKEAPQQNGSAASDDYGAFEQYEQSNGAR